MIEKKRYVLVTAEPLPTTDDQPNIDNIDVPSLVAQYACVKQSPLVMPHPAGVFLVEPPPGLYEFLKNYVKMASGIISLAARTIEDPTATTLLLTYDEFEIGTSQYRELIFNELERYRSDTSALTTELITTDELMEACAV